MSYKFIISNSKNFIFRVAFISIGFVLLLAGNAQTKLSASCGASICPLDFQTKHRLAARTLMFSYDFEYIDQSQPMIGTRLANVGEIRGHHDEVYTRNQIHRINLAYAITDRLNVTARLPLVNLSHKHVHHHHGEQIEDTWEFFAPGDIFAEARYIFGRVGNPTAVRYGLTAAVKMPSGTTHITNDKGSEAEPGIAAGTGSWDFKAGVFVSQAYNIPVMTDLAKFTEFFISGNYRYNTASHHEDYKIGNILDVNAGFSYPLFDEVRLTGQFNFVRKEVDGKGTSHEETEKTGGEFVYASPGLEYLPFKHLQIAATIQLPLYQRVNQIQLTSKYNLMFQLAYKVDFN